MSREVVQFLTFLGCQVASIGVFAIGLIGPLTPSEGQPSLPAFGLFLAFPICIALLPGFRARSRGALLLFLLLASPTLGVIAWFSWELGAVWLP